MQEARMRDGHFSPAKENINGDGIGYGNENIITPGGNNSTHGSRLTISSSNSSRNSFAPAFIQGGFTPTGATTTTRTFTPMVQDLQHLHQLMQIYLKLVPHEEQQQQQQLNVCV